MKIFPRTILSTATLLLLLTLPMVTQAVRAAATNVVPDAVELAALKELYDSLSGSGWLNKDKNNWPKPGAWPSSATSTQFGTWLGVRVVNGDITEIDLSANNLIGEIPASLGDLKSLTFLNLGSNKLTGRIPARLGELTLLTKLHLYNNKLEAGIPATLGNLYNLEDLQLQANLLTDGIPSSFVNLTNIKKLSLSDNQLTGKIPTLLSRLTKLQELRLQVNQLEGGIPPFLGLLTDLTTLHLYGNPLGGHIPTSLGNLKKLVTLTLNNNELDGAIPASFAELTELKTLNLSDNNLSGTIPALDKLRELRILTLWGNELSGSIPTGINALTWLSDLHLNDNKLTGPIPPMGNLRALQTLNLQSNQLSGPIPESFRQLISMETFYLQDNRLEGTLSADFIAGWTNVELIDVSRNQLQGDFPLLASKSRLVSVKFDRNAFHTLSVDMALLPVMTLITAQDNELTTVSISGPPTGQIKKLTLAVQNNRLDYATLQTLKSLTLRNITLAPQRMIRDVIALTPATGGSLVIPSRPTGSYPTTNILWEKQQANGRWKDVAAQNQDATRSTFTRTAYTAADEGTYRWRMPNIANSPTPEITTLESEPITVKTSERTVLDNYAFQYKYDARRRMTHKKVPGADWVYMVYDERDRLVMTQDGEQRKRNAWTFTRYDPLNRPIITGIYRDTATLDQAQMTQRISITNFSETFTGAVAHHGYTNTVFPSTTFLADSFDIHTVTYYDNYDFKAGWSADFNYAANRIASQTQAGYSYAQPDSAFTRVIGQVTGTKVKTTGSDPYWLCAVNYYDAKGRLIQQVSENYKGGTDRATTVYDFVGKVLASTTEHTINTLTWQNLVGARVEVDNLARFVANNSWGTSGASSAQMIPANTDGWAETTASGTSTFRMMGVSAQDGNQHYLTMDYAFYLRGKDLAIYEKTKGINNVYVVPGGLNPGDKLRIERRNNQLRFYRNGVQVYPLNGAGLACTTPLLTDVSFNTNRGSINHTRMSVTQGKPQTIKREFTYDHAGRLLKVWHTTNASPKILLVDNTYNSLGQLVTKKLHSDNAGSTFKQHEDFRYNIRGWLERINQSSLIPERAGDPQDYFGMNLMYAEVIPSLASTPQFNGNITAVIWNNGLGQGDVSQVGYRYYYDAMNRITGADYRQKRSDWGVPSHLDDDGNPQTSDAFSETGYDYDLNGNLKRLVRKGAKGHTLDELTYTYGATEGQESNRLLGVADAGDKHQGFDDANTVGDDYIYDSNGSMVADKNKNVSSITYNHLNLPIKVVKTTGEYIRYIYDAGGRKHSQQVYSATNVLTKRSDYPGELFYENDTLRFINHEEGRIVMTDATPEYQYHLKDHLGNVRVTFTSKHETETATATLEDANAATERGQFLNYDEAVTLNEPLFDHTHRLPGNEANTTFRSTRLLGGPDSTAMYGLAKSFSVMPGDKITAKVYAKYVDSSDPQVQQALRDFLASLGMGNTGGPLVDGGGPGSLGGGIFPFATYFNHEDEDGSGPKAYLNYLIYDRDFNPLNGGFKRLTINGRETGETVGTPLPNGGFDVLAFEDGDIKITEPGFVYIYFSNENENRVEVFFDDFEVTHTKSPVVQQDDYYPFGLTFNSYSREKAVNQKYRFQNQEHIDDLGLDWDSFKWRNHQPDIGRFFNIDPLAEKYVHNSVYAFSENKLISYRELEGLEADPAYCSGCTETQRQEEIRKQQSQEHRNRFWTALPTAVEKTGDEAAKMTDLNDLNVLATMLTKNGDAINVDGTPASKSDKGFAMAGVFLPFVSGSAVKKAVNIGENILNLTGDGKRLTGAMELGENSSIIFDGKVRVDGGNLHISEIGFYQTEGAEILGAGNKGTNGSLPLKILNQLKNSAAADGFSTLILHYKRALYDEVGNFVKYAEDVSKKINLKNQ